MSNNDQQLVDHLYNTIFTQQLRCNHFNNSGYQSHNSVWNKHPDEKKILNIMVENYKNYYKNKVEELKEKLLELKEININSYLTYNAEYYVNQYNERLEEINKYLVEIDLKTIDHIAKDKLNSISTVIDSDYPDFFATPTLLGRIV